MDLNLLLIALFVQWVFFFFGFIRKAWIPLLISLMTGMLLLGQLSNDLTITYWAGATQVNVSLSGVTLFFFSLPVLYTVVMMIAYFRDWRKPV